MNSTWKVWINTKNKNDALKVSERLARLVDFPVVPDALEPYQKGGFVAQWDFELPMNRADSIVDHIRKSESIGTPCTLMGQVDAVVEGLLSTTGGGTISVSGVSMVLWTLLDGDRTGGNDS